MTSPDVAAHEDIHVAFLTTEKHGVGFYWWADGFDNDKIGPFATANEAHHDIFLLSQEGDGY